jgi:hypothetical protein
MTQQVVVSLADTTTLYFMDVLVQARSILQHLQAKGALPPPPDLLPATRAPLTLDWFV